MFLEIKGKRRNCVIISFSKLSGIFSCTGNRWGPKKQKTKSWFLFYSERGTDILYLGHPTIGYRAFLFEAKNMIFKRKIISLSR